MPTKSNCLKSHNRIVFHLVEENPLTPTELICTKICTEAAVPDVIMCAKFWTEIFRGYDFTWVDFSIFLLILGWASQHAELMHCLWQVSQTGALYAMRCFGAIINIYHSGHCPAWRL